MIISGRFLYEEYFSTLDKAYQMVFSSLRNRIGLPVHPYGQVSLTRHHIMQYYPPPVNPDPNFLDEDTKEEFVALQSYPRLASPSYRANFSFGVFMILEKNQTVKIEFFGDM